MSMRQIKFRGWHTGLKHMFPAEELGTDQMTILPSTGEFINVHFVSTKLSKIYPLDKFVPMQFTGLKDHKGNEIYEGDIVKVSEFQDDATAKTYLVKYFDDGLYPAFDLDGYDSETNGISEALNALYIEVIGNIYENPELLKTK
jgi:uncharacterized phage protein (TIGR01671 family)